MGIALNTIGVQVGYAVEATAGTRPTTGYIYFEDIKSTPDFNPAPSGIDSTTFDNKEYTSSIDGLKEMDDSLEFGANFTQKLQTDWATCVSAYQTAIATQKNTWFVVVVPGLEKACYFKGKPSAMGLPSMDANALLETSVYVTPVGEPQWETKPTK